MLLDELGALLASVDSLADGSLELRLVGLLEGSDHLAALSGLSLVGLDNAGELLDLLIGSGVVLGDLLAELLDLLDEGSLGLANSIHGVELHALVLPEGSPDTAGSLLEGVLGVGTVLGELLA